MNTIIRHYPFERYPSINRPDEFIDLEGARERAGNKTDSKKGKKKGIAHKTILKQKPMYSEEMWIIK